MHHGRRRPIRSCSLHTLMERMSADVLRHSRQIRNSAVKGLCQSFHTPQWQEELRELGDWEKSPDSEDVTLQASAGETSVFESCGSSADSRFRIQGQAESPAAHSLRCSYSEVLVHTAPLPVRGLGGTDGCTHRFLTRPSLICFSHACPSVPEPGVAASPAVVNSA